MAMTGYLTLEGTNQGKIEGDVTQKGREKSILVYGIEHAIEIPKDTHTGMPTGQRIHMPFCITKHLDQSSPKIMQAVTSGEHMKTFELKYFRINDKGQEEHYYTVKLENAIVVGTKHTKLLTFLPENKPYHDMEDVCFTYEKITTTYEPSGIEAEDNWKEPKSS
ncbi:MAG: type VI secretion system tube protein Hcp [Helicobacteraceae bacterium]|nr:type VI secretion system tube protein Hcp [Helicobacteraceae bacterium]